MERSLQQTTGEILCADKTYKVVKYIISSFGGARAYDSLYTVMNEFNQVVSLKFCYSGNDIEIEEMLRDIRKRLTLQGIGPIKVFYTDNCCSEYKLLSGTFPELLDERKSLPKTNTIVHHCVSHVAPSPSLNLPLVELPVKAAVISTYQQLQNWCESVSAQMTKSSEFIGFDVEWDSVLTNNRAVRTLQLAFKEFICVAQLDLIYVGVTDEVIASHKNCLKILFEHPSIVLSGVGIKGDLTRLMKRPYAEWLFGKKDHIKVYSLEQQYKIASLELRCFSLQALAELFLQATIPKNDSIRRSRWSSETLTEDQVTYAALDAYVAYILANKIEQYCKTFRPPKDESELTQGTPVRLTAISSQDVVGFGVIIGPCTNPYATSSTKKRKVTKQYSVRVARVRKPGALALDGNLMSTFINKVVIWPMSRLLLSTTVEVGSVTSTLFSSNKVLSSLEASAEKHSSTVTSHTLQSSNVFNTDQSSLQVSADKESSTLSSNTLQASVLSNIDQSSLQASAGKEPSTVSSHTRQASVSSETDQSSLHASVRVKDSSTVTSHTLQSSNVFNTDQPSLQVSAVQESSTLSSNTLQASVLSNTDQSSLQASAGKEPSTVSSHTRQASVSSETDQSSFRASVSSIYPDGTKLDDYPEYHQTSDHDSSSDTSDDESEKNVCSVGSGIDCFWKKNKIKLDPFHAINRIKRTLKKQHGIYDTFLGLFRDAIFIPCPEDLASEKRLDVDKNETLTVLPLSGKVLRNVRRVCPEPKIMEDNLRLVVNICANVPDARTGEIFFSKKSWKEYESLLSHVRHGCLSDPEGVSLYHKDDNSSIRCVRGTSQLECFHAHIRKIFKGYHCNVESSVMTVALFIHRWNHDRGIERGLIDEQYRYVYEGWLIEEIQSMGKRFGLRLYDSFSNVQDYIDTGETFYTPIVVQGNNSNQDEDLFDDINDDDVEFLGVKLSNAIKFEAERAGTSLPVTRVMVCEQWLFEKLYNGGNSFDQMAEQWNNIVKLEQRKPLPERRKIFPKTAGLLNSYNTEKRKKANVVETLTQNNLSKKAEETTMLLREQGLDHRFQEIEKITRRTHPQTQIRNELDNQVGITMSPAEIANKGIVRCRRCGNCRVLHKHYHSVENVRSNSNEYCRMNEKSSHWVTRPGYNVNDEEKKENTKATQKWWKEVKNREKIDERAHWSREWWSEYEIEMENNK